MSHITTLTTIVDVQLNLVTTNADFENPPIGFLYIFLIFDFKMYKRIIVTHHYENVHLPLPVLLVEREMRQDGLILGRRPCAFKEKKREKKTRNKSRRTQNTPRNP